MRLYKSKSIILSHNYSVKAILFEIKFKNISYYSFSKPTHKFMSLCVCVAINLSLCPCFIRARPGKFRNRYFAYKYNLLFVPRRKKAILHKLSFSTTDLRINIEVTFKFQHFSFLFDVILERMSFVMGRGLHMASSGTALDWVSPIASVMPISSSPTFSHSKHWIKDPRAKPIIIWARPAPGHALLPILSGFRFPILKPIGLKS